MNKVYKLFFSIFFVAIFFMGCSNDLVSPEAIALINQVNDGETLLYRNESDPKTVKLNVKTTNGVGINFVAYQINYFYSDNTPVSDQSLNRTGAISRFVPGYDQADINVTVITPELEQFIIQNETTVEDDIKSMIIRINLIGVDENENQISVSANLEALFG